MVKVPGLMYMMLEFIIMMLTLGWSSNGDTGFDFSEIFGWDVREYDHLT